MIKGLVRADVAQQLADRLLPAAADGLAKALNDEHRWGLLRTLVRVRVAAADLVSGTDRQRLEDQTDELLRQLENLA